MDCWVEDLLQNKKGKVFYTYKKTSDCSSVYQYYTLSDLIIRKIRRIPKRQKNGTQKLHRQSFPILSVLTRLPVPSILSVSPDVPIFRGICKMHNSEQKKYIKKNTNTIRPVTT